MFLSEDGIVSHIRQIAERMLKDHSLKELGLEEIDPSDEVDIDKLDKKSLNVDLVEEKVYKPLVSFETFVAQKN